VAPLPPSFLDFIGGIAFNIKFDFVFRSITDRLRRYHSADACGKCTATLFDDFRSDSDFLRTLDELFSEVVGQYTNGECITSDGLSLEHVEIFLGTAINLSFQLHFLDAPHGYGMAPAKFSVATDTTRDDCMHAKLYCGLRDPDGEFWYPSTKRLQTVAMSDDYNWAYSQTRTYGPPTISSWIDRRILERGDPSG
jgi:hypothetical protein